MADGIAVIVGDSVSSLACLVLATRQLILFSFLCMLVEEFVNDRLPFPTCVIFVRLSRIWDFHSSLHLFQLSVKRCSSANHSRLLDTCHRAADPRNCGSVLHFRNGGVRVGWGVDFAIGFLTRVSEPQTGRYS